MKIENIELTDWIPSTDGAWYRFCLYSHNKEYLVAILPNSNNKNLLLVLFNGLIVENISKIFRTTMFDIISKFNEIEIIKNNIDSFIINYDKYKKLLAFL